MDIHLLILGMIFSTHIELQSPNITEQLAGVESHVLTIDLTSVINLACCIASSTNVLAVILAMLDYQSIALHSGDMNGTLC